MTEHHYEIGILFNVLCEFLSDEKARAAEILKKLLHIRRLCRNPPSLSRVIEHPSPSDRTGVLIRLAKRLAYSQNCVTFRDSSGEGRKENPALSAAVGQQQARHQSDVDLIIDQQRKVRAHGNSASRLVGIVWASSGDATKMNHKNQLEEDWALVNLFRNANERFRNEIGNMLRPNNPEDRFQAVKRWTGPIRMEVTKRGRTTNCTMGTVNGPSSVFNRGSSTTRQYGIVKSPTNIYFSQPGDSGSWIMDRNGQLIGMINSGLTHFIRGPQNTDADDSAPDDVKFQDITYFTPATFLFEWIQEAFESAMKEQGVELTTKFDPGERIVLLAPDDQSWG